MSEAIHDATDGNPFFVGEIVRLMVAEDSVRVVLTYMTISVLVTITD